MADLAQHAPPPIISLASATDGRRLKLKPTMCLTPACVTAASISFASARVLARGFSQRIVFARLRRRQNDVLVRVTRRRHVDQVDVRPVYDPAPVCLRLFPAELGGRVLHLGRIATTHHLRYNSDTWTRR